ncbi:MAG TPA: ATP-binding protein, partial [Steroidobacteraceae bacterium]
MKWRTLGRGRAVQLACVWIAGVLTGSCALTFLHGMVGAGAAILTGLPVCIWLARRTPNPIENVIRALQSSVASYSDGHFGHSLVTDFPKEIRPLVDVHNELGNVLRTQRNHLVQRELMLETIVENSPVALLLVDNYERVTFSNTAARELIGDGRKLDGVDFNVLMERLPVSIRDAVASGEDGVFAMDIGDFQETLLLLVRDFRLSGLAHKLYVLRPVTREMARAEVATWKKVIRVVTHELNNTLAPISSLTFTGREFARAGALDRLPEIFAGIRERTEHLQRFVQGYASFARLPSPRSKYMNWEGFLSGLNLQAPVCRIGVPPEQDGYFDPGQIEQVLANLVKNAHESGSPSEAVELEVTAASNVFTIEVRDRGTGMSEATLANAFLPFYSTKRTGTGLGLAISREIVEAHRGRLTLNNRRGGGLSVIITCRRRSREPMGPRQIMCCAIVGLLIAAAA